MITSRKRRVPSQPRQLTDLTMSTPLRTVPTEWWSQGRGVPDLVLCSGSHTEGHHLIRCLAPENAKNKALPTEE